MEQSARPNFTKSPFKRPKQLENRLKRRLSGPPMPLEGYVSAAEVIVQTSLISMYDSGSQFAIQKLFLNKNINFIGCCRQPEAHD